MPSDSKLNDKGNLYNDNIRKEVNNVIDIYLRVSMITGFAQGMEILEWHGISLVKNQALESMEFYKWHGNA